MKSALAHDPSERPREQGPLRNVASEFFESKGATIGFITFSAIVSIALFSPWLAPQNPYDLAKVTISDGTIPPGGSDIQGIAHWLGTDEQGRDMLSAIIYGMRVSLFVAFTSIAFALMLGIVVGLVAAFSDGWMDSVLMRLVDIQLSFPSILTALILIAILGSGIDKVIIALVTAQWAFFARMIRSSALVEKNKEYVEAARGLSFSASRVLFRHLLPNCLPPLIVMATVQTAFAIALESTLSFLGLGLPITEPSLGLLVANGFEYLLSGKYWISFFPGAALFVMVCSINLIGDRLRDVLNPRMKK